MTVQLTWRLACSATLLALAHDRAAASCPDSALSLPYTSVPDNGVIAVGLQCIEGVGKCVDPSDVTITVSRPGGDPVAGSLTVVRVDGDDHIVAFAHVSN